MSRDIRFRYVYRHRKTGELKSHVFPIGQIDGGAVHTLEDKRSMEWFALMSRDQWTGLHDRNGTPIFESDVVSFYHVSLGKIISEVKFQRGCFMFFPKVTGVSFGELSRIEKSCIVLGSKWENPDLLETPEGGGE